MDNSIFFNKEEYIILYKLFFENIYFTTSKYILNHDYLNLRFVNIKGEFDENVENLSKFIYYYENIILIRSNCKIPLSLKYFYDIIKSILSLNINYNNISYILIKFLNHIVDGNQISKEKISFSETIKKIFENNIISDWISEIRHSIIHKQNPPILHIEILSTYLIIYILKYYWQKNYINLISNISIDILKKTQIKIQSIINISNNLDIISEIKILKYKNKLNSKIKINKINNLKIKDYIQLSYNNQENILKNIIKNKKLNKLINKLLKYFTNYQNNEPDILSCNLLILIFNKYVNVSDFRNIILNSNIKQYFIIIHLYQNIFENFKIFFKIIYLKFSKIINNINIFNIFLHIENINFENFKINQNVLLNDLEYQYQTNLYKLLNIY